MTWNAHQLVDLVVKIFATQNHAQDQIKDHPAQTNTLATQHQEVIAEMLNATHLRNVVWTLQNVKNVLEVKSKNRFCYIFVE